MNSEFRSLKCALFTGCAIFALAGTAHAADAPAASGTNAPIPGEIIVTAQRRNESLQNVPMTLQALSGDALEKLNVTTFNDLLRYTPNVTFGNNGPGSGSIFMRGLSTGFAGNQSAAANGLFPNVAVYLDDQSMQFPFHNVDVYAADLERIEVLEGPQGTLFGGGAEAGAVRYITNKPKLNKLEAKIEASAGGTVGGAPNGAFSGMVNIPVLQDKLAIRAVVYDDHHGGYINNVYSDFTRSNYDAGNPYLNIKPTGGVCPNGLPAGGTGYCTVANQVQGQYNNSSTVKNNFNPADTTGVRVSALWEIAPDWSLLVSEMYQHIDAEGTFSTQPYGDNFQPLGALQTTTFAPSWNRDTVWNTSWTVSGKIGGLKAIYTGAYLTRNVDQQQDYTNYSRGAYGTYYQCTGGNTAWVPGQAAQCGSPVGYWRDQFRSTHQTHELRISTPDTGKIRAIVGAYYEKFRIYDDMNFSYKSIPACNAANTQLLINSIGTGNIQDCTASVGPAPGSTINVPGLRADNVAFGEDLQRGYDQIAGFGSVDVDLTSTLTVTAGTRYYNYLNTEVGSQYGTGGGCDGLTLYEAALANGGYNGGGLGQCPGSLHNIDAAHDRTRYTGFKSRAGINWKPEDGILIYGLFSQGFRPGGFNRTGGQAKLGGQFIRPYSWTPDTLTNWEAGIKSSWLDHKLTLNLSSYYMVWNNAQIVLFAPTTFGNTAFATNGSTFHIEGAELQVTGRPTSSLTIQGSASYNHARQSSVRPWVSAIDGSPITSAPNPYGAIGSPLPFSPDLQANIHARYEWGGKGDLNWFVASGANYSGSTYNQPANYASGDAVVPGIPSTVQGPNGVIIPTTTLLRYKMPGYALVDASFGFSHDNLTVSVFGENLTNTHVSTFTSSAQFAKSEVPVRPMIYGLKLAIKY